MAITSMITRRALAAFVCLLGLPAADAATVTPLLDYALAQQYEPSSRDTAYQRRVKETRSSLSRNPPPEENCAQTLGAGRFATMYENLGEALDGVGEYEAALEAYRRALECAPRASYLRPPLAKDLLYLNRYEEARAAAEQGLAADESDIGLNAVLAELDFIDERWTDAIPRLRLVATNAEDDEFAAYFQCLLWLAQRQAGISRPELVARDDPEGWPQPLLATFRGEIDETEVVKRIAGEADLPRRREILAEALFYIGQQRLADGDLETGRRYMASIVNLKVHYFLEHHLALAELAKVH